MLLIDETELAERIDALLDNWPEGAEVYITRAGKIVVKIEPCQQDE